MVEEETELREESVYYAGNNTPTRHLFGLKNEPYILKGRWMDGALGGPGSAKAKRDEVKRIQRMQLPVSVSWGEAIYVFGIIKRLKSSWESQAEIAWELEILIDDDADQLSEKTFEQKTPTDYSKRLRLVFDSMVESGSDTALKVPIQDALGLIVGALLQPIADLEAIANEMKSIKDGTIGQIRRFRAGLAMTRRAMGTFRGLFESTSPELALAFQDASAEVGLTARQAQTSRQITEAFAEIAEAERDARRAEVSKIRSVVTAQPGDTWESISVQVYGDASRAAELRSANDVGTSSPVPGETYVAPV
ncbi:MAG TPA: hypothetical protein VHO25_06230 [Polyangiaceae bacterium]|nr:hypothetical protein [Polyangiaceae bacterium]